MNTWSWIALALTALQGLWCLLCLCRRELPPQPGETKRFPWGGGFVALSMVLEALMAAFVVSFALLGAGGVEMLFALFQLLATALVTEACLHVLALTRDGFVIRTHFGRVHTCRWEDVLSCTGDPKSAGGATSLKTKDKRFFLSFLPPTNMALLGMIRAERQKRGLGPLPIRRASLDPFGGHVRDWQGLLAAYAIVTALCLGMLGVCAAEIIRPIPMEKTEERIVSFSAWSDWRDDDLRFIGTDGEAYVVNTGVENMTPVREVCGTSATFTVLARRVQPNRGDAYRRVYALHGADGTAYLTLEESVAHERQTWGMVSAVWVVLSLVWAGYVLRSIQVGRHPERYSRRTIRRYFKDGYVR